MADASTRRRARRGRRGRCPDRRGPRRGSPRLEALPPLLGIPVALKDLVSVKGGQATAGSRILEGYVAPYDAHITERLRAVGRGHPRQDEHGRVRDGLVDREQRLRPGEQPLGPRHGPRRQQRRLGGRGGRGPVPLGDRHRHRWLDPPAGGADRGRRASSRPTVASRRYGIVAFASSLDQIGPFARDVRDAAALLHAVAGRDERDSTSAPVPVPDECSACRR